MGRWIVSVKGVLVWNNAVVLVRNERDEWELPGGQLEPNESPEQCVERELAEELFVTAEAVELLDTYVFEVVPEVRIVIITYGCAAPQPDELRHSSEHNAIGLFPMHELDGLVLPTGYRKSIDAWRDRLAYR